MSEPGSTSKNTIGRARVSSWVAPPSTACSNPSTSTLTTDTGVEPRPDQKLSRVVTGTTSTSAWCSLNSALSEALVSITSPVGSGTNSLASPSASPTAERTSVTRPLEPLRARLASRRRITAGSGSKA